MSRNNRNKKNSTLAPRANNSPKFEIVLQKRNFKGELTGQKVSYATDSTGDLYGWFCRNQPIKKQQKSKDSTTNLPTANEAENILDNIFGNEGDLEVANNSPVVETDDLRGEKKGMVEQNDVAAITIEQNNDTAGEV